MTLSSLYFISPRAPITTGIVSVFISYILLNSISRPLDMDTFSVNFGEVQYLFQMEYCYVNEQASSFFLVLDDYNHWCCDVVFIIIITCHCYCGITVKQLYAKGENSLTG